MIVTYMLPCCFLKHLLVSGGLTTGVSMYSPQGVENNNIHVPIWSSVTLGSFLLSCYEFHHFLQTELDIWQGGRSMPRGLEESLD